MNTKSKYIPEGFHTVTPYLTVKDPKEAIAFYKRAFGARERMLMPTPVGLALYVENVDDVFKRAVSAGATSKEPVETKFWGDRAGSLTDPFGHKWMLLTHVEDVPPDEMKKRMAQAFSMASAKS